MTLASQMAAAFDATYNTDEFAESVDYTPKGGAKKTITAIVSRVGPSQEPYVRGEATARAVVRCRKSEVTNPQQGDLFEFDSADWYVDPDGVEAANRIGGAVYEWDIHVWRND
jgi:hypothetical protein